MSPLKSIKRKPLLLPLNQKLTRMIFKKCCAKIPSSYYTTSERDCIYIFRSLTVYRATTFFLFYLRARGVDTRQIRAFHRTAIHYGALVKIYLPAACRSRQTFVLLHLGACRLLKIYIVIARRPETNATNVFARGLCYIHVRLQNFPSIWIRRFLRLRVQEIALWFGAGNRLRVWRISAIR